MQYSKFSIRSIAEAGEDVRIFSLENAEGAPPQYRPGNFFLLRLNGADGKPIFRSYSASSHPSEKGLSFCIKKKGTFTSLLWGLKEGDSIEVGGPYGLFTLEENDSERVFVAGGVGIAPIRGMAIETARQGKPFTVFQSSKTPPGLAYRQEFEALAKRTAGALYFVALTQDCTGEGECIRGRLSAEVINEKLGSLDGKSFYICGAKEMAAAISEGLQKQGVPKAKIKIEAWG
jgi:Na+-transporting NADH:ubiquinone oxidoreductase subunit F